MTLEQLRNSDKVMVVPKDINAILGCDSESINIQAREDQRKLGFPVCVMGTRVRIPRVAFLKWLDGVGMFDGMQEAEVDYDNL